MYSPVVFNKLFVKPLRRELRKNSTDAERKLWSKLRAKQLFGFKFYRQFSAGPYIIDFYCSSCHLAIELDGGQHAKDKKIIYDRRRTDYLLKNKIRLIRFWNNDVLTNIDGILKEILNNLTPPNLPLK